MPQNPPVPYAVSGPYVTQLPPQQESQFQTWVKQNKIPWQDSPTADYDMRGFYKAMVSGDPNAKRAANLHFPDTYKTPYHKTFSNESKYATKDAPHWEGDRLVTKDGRILADESPNPAASAVVSAPPGPPAPETQSPDVQTQIPEQPAQTMNPAAQGMGGTPAPTPTPTPNQAQLAKQVKTGLGWHALMGTHTEYQQGPNGPVAVPIQNKPGQLFRSILAGAIMGMGAGGENTGGSGWGAIGAGARAAHQNFEQQQQKQQQDAQQQWENQRQADKDRRDATAFDTEQQVRKAQIAQANAETLHTNVLTQGSSFDLHNKIADADKERISTFTNAGVKPVFEDIPESQMNDIIKNSPGASTLDWRHTGVKTVLDKDGNPTYEYTLSAYDPKATAPLSEGTVKQWEEDGLFKYHPEYKEVAKPGKVLSVDQFTALDKQAQNYYNQNLSKNKTDLELKELQAKIDEAHAAVKAHNATAAHEGLSSALLKQQNEKQKAEDAAWDALAKAGNDPTKLTDPHQRAILAQSVRPLMQETMSAIKATAVEAQNGDKTAEAELPDMWSRYNTYSKLASLSPEAAEKLAHPEVATALHSVPGLNPQAVNLIANMDPTTIPGYLAASSLPQPMKDSIAKALKITLPSPPSPLSPLGKATVNAAKEVVPAVSTAISIAP